MDSRVTYGSALKTVAPGQFTNEQRRRLEAFTAARGLLHEDLAEKANAYSFDVVEKYLDVAEWITDGVRDR